MVVFQGRDFTLSKSGSGTVSRTFWDDGWVDRSFSAQVKASGVSANVRASILATWETPAVQRGARPEAPPATAGGGAVKGTACPSAISGRDKVSSGEANPFLPQIRGLNPSRLTFYAGGRLSRLKVNRNNGTIRLQDRHKPDIITKRGEIRGFSWRSRNRLLDELAKVDRDQVEVGQWRFITLTYRNQQITARASKRHVKMFHKRMSRHFGPVAMVWKLEPHESGKEQPHYHCMMLLPASWQKDLAAEREAFAKAWTEITNEGGWDDAQYAVNVYGGDHEDGEKNYKAAWQMMHSWEEVLGYTAKYVGKVVTEGLPSTFGKPGRWWGMMGWDLVPVTEVHMDIDEKVTARVHRVLRKMARAKTRDRYIPQNWPGFDKWSRTVNKEREEPGVMIAQEIQPGYLHLPTQETLRRWRGMGVELRPVRSWVRAGCSCRYLGDPLEMVRLVQWAVGGPYAKRQAAPEIPF